MIEYNESLNNGIDKQFQRHLENNKKIFFSGKYGMGKTMFIENFFNKTEFGAGYYPVFVSPLKYLTSTNENIFQLLKFDIFNQLLKDDLITLDIRNDNIINRFIKEKGQRKKLIYDVFLSLTKLTPYIGESLSEFVDNISNLKSGSEDTSLTKEDIVDKFKNFFTDVSLYQDDIITQSINDALDKRQKSVLIIDDLDRLDPNDIFRILNIFTAFDNYYGNDKPWINFDRVLLIGDIKNLESIFTSRYGKTTDFSGYIDKFFNHAIFSFDNKNNVQDLVGEILENKIECRSSTHLNRLVLNDKFSQFLFDLISNDALNTRRLFIAQNRELFDIQNEEIKVGKETVNSVQYPMLIQSKFLIWLFGDVNLCINSLARYDHIKPNIKNEDYYFNFLERYVPLIKHKLRFDTDKIFYLGSNEIRDSLFKEDIYGFKICFNGINSQNIAKNHFPTVANMFIEIINEFEIA